MNDQDFQHRALSNPKDSNPDFLAAAAQSAQRREWLDELLEFEAKLENVLQVPADEALRQRLLDPASLSASAADEGSATPAWKRPLPVTLCLLVLVGGLLFGL